MEVIMKRNTMLLAAALIAVPTTTMAVPMMYEQQVAHQEEARILRSPIGGIQNSRWFDYRTNINETRKELASDLRQASDTEDRRDAWDEYGTELRHERVTYVKDMAKKGYRIPRVYVGDY
jgi:hypothetical protein